MQIRFQCTRCETRLEIDADSAGRSIQCPTCGATQVVPRCGLGPGAVIGGFEIVRLIGRGGMGEVYLARQRSLDRMVALKVLSPHMAPSSEAVQRFVREIRLTARLEHPYLVTAYEGGEDNGIVYLAMAYVRGASLHERIRRIAPLTEVEALELGRKVASALRYAWDELRMLHRDIKPSNILIDAHGEPRLADLGLAKCLGRPDGTTMAGAVLGTPNYMSPEQAEGRDDLDVRSDIYSLGASLFTAVTGQVPYHAGSLMEVLRRQATEPLPDPRAFAPELSAEFVDFLGLLLARDRRERPKDWAAALAEFDRHLLRHPGPAGILPIAEAANDEAALAAPPRRTWSTRILVSAAAAAALVLGAASGWWWTSASRKAAAPADHGRAPPSAPADGSLLPPEPVEADVQMPGRPPLQPEVRRHLIKLWMETRDYAREHPDDLEGQLNRIQRAIASAPDSPMARQAEQWMQSTRLVERIKLRQLEQELRNKAEADLKAGRYDDGLAALAEYDGPMADETRELRESLAARLREAREAALAAEAELQIRTAIEQSAAAAARGHWTEAQSLLSNAASEPRMAVGRDRLAAAAELAALAAGWNARVLASFRDQRGQKIPIEFRDGRIETLHVAGVTDTAVLARRLLPEGFIELTIAPTDLSLRERERRAAPPSPGAAAFLRGVGWLEAGDRSRAAAEFSASGTDWGADIARALAPP